MVTKDSKIEIDEREMRNLELYTLARRHRAAKRMTRVAEASSSIEVGE
jgi:hypothetical protein